LIPFKPIASVIESPAETKGTGADRSGMVPFASKNADLTLNPNAPLYVATSRFLRRAGRVIDNDSTGSMEKQEGYF
jgi:hypothetical protein